ncbi:unnamed protein product [Brachionus calyciflorus]|uniref:Transposase IS30-like HTH domain-containing protein n=1 Tax=Brachionus calyciflorus TaxID=104777 RepID=A0A813MBI7_9BILA|nr:unnamed protein product [Brachionus calyciflorus]
MPSKYKKRPSVTPEDRIKAVMMFQQEKSFATIGRELNRTKSWIKRIIDRNNETFSYQDPPKSGRPHEPEIEVVYEAEVVFDDEMDYNCLLVHQESVLV